MTKFAGGKAVLLLAGAFAASLAGQAPAADGAAEAREAIRKADVAFGEAVKSRDRARFAALLAEDARFFTAGEPSGKREEVVKDWEIFFGEDGPRLTWAPVHVEAAASGDLGYSTGRYEWGGKNADGTPRISAGWYVTIWRKGADGLWRAALDIGTPPSPKKP
jgi:ketosteroid isomerase-like protein